MPRVPTDIRLSAVTAYYIREISKGNTSPSVYMGYPDGQIEDAARQVIDRFENVLEYSLVKKTEDGLLCWSLSAEGVTTPITWTTTGKSNVENLAAMLVNPDLAKGSGTATQK